MLKAERCSREGCNRLVQAPAFASGSDLRANQRGFCSADCETEDNNERKDE